MTGEPWTRPAVQHLCGHAAHFPTQFRAWKIPKQQAFIAKQQQRPCLTCYRQQQAQALFEEAEAAGLPPLRGTEKQIIWALTLRQRRLDEFQHVFGWLSEAPETGKIPWIATTLRHVQQDLQNETDAGWWIGRRSATLWAVLGERLQLRAAEEGLVYDPGAADDAAADDGDYDMALDEDYEDYGRHD